VRIIEVAETIVRSSSPIAVGLGKGLQPLKRGNAQRIFTLKA